MKNFFKNWRDGLKCLFIDDRNSFYTYFTIILAEMAFLWWLFPANALFFTFLLALCVINVTICTFLKGAVERKKTEAMVVRVYVGVFIGIFIGGCFENALVNIVLMVIPLIITALWIEIREYQNLALARLPDNNTNNPMHKTTFNNFLYVISQIIIIGIPFILFTVFLTLTPISLALKITIPVVYAFFIPLIVFVENDTSACNIFELAFDVSWSQEMEKLYKNLDEIKIKKEKIR